MKPSRREYLLFALLALVASFFVVQLVSGPTITDALYHLNAANALVRGEGLVDHYLWVYIGAPDHLPAPSHLYWMPLDFAQRGAGHVAAERLRRLCGGTDSASL